MNALSVVIPTYCRAEVLLDTVGYLLHLPEQPLEILIVDQTTQHPPQMQKRLDALEERGVVRRIQLAQPSITHAMNAGLREARGDVVLFLDDDIVPDANLVAAHRAAHEQLPEAWAVVGKVVQRGRDEGGKVKAGERGEGGKLNAEGESQRSEAGDRTSDGSRQDVKGLTLQHTQLSGFSPHPVLRRDLAFGFNGPEPAWVENVMAGNLSVKREKALAMGGFDENFIPPVSFRFETEFAKRIMAAGGLIRFEPKASLLHLRAASGGTRSQGSHLTSASPVHGVGDYYYALKHGKGWDRVWYMACRPFREICTQFHLRHPWWIPVKLIGELRAMWMAVGLHRAGPKLLPNEDAAKACYGAQYAGSRYAAYAEPKMHPFYAEIDRLLDQYGRRNGKWLEVGCGRGVLQDVVDDYTGVDVAAAAAAFMHKPFCCARAEALPFEDGVYDGLWSYAVLEHVEHPELALCEMRRVLKPGGMLILSPAWQCRPWAGRDYAWKAWRDLSMSDRLRKALIPLRNAVPVRACSVFPRRIMHVMQYVMKQTPLRFYTRALTPNYSDYNVIDADARHHMDPFDAILWFRSRGDRVLSHPGWRRQFFVRTRVLVIEICKRPS